MLTDTGDDNNAPQCHWLIEEVEWLQTMGLSRAGILQRLGYKLDYRGTEALARRLYRCGRPDLAVGFWPSRVERRQHQQAREMAR